MKVSIRPMTLADYDAVVGLFNALDAYHREHLPWLFRRSDEPPRSRSFFDGILQDDKAKIFVAGTERVVGFIHAGLFHAPDFPIFIPQLRIAINNVFVDPVHRRHGIASLLLQEAEAWGKARGAVGVDLNVYEFNEKGQGMFSAMGFSTLSRRMSKPLP